MEAPAASSHIELVLSKLDRVTRRGRGWTARCPAHDDADPSLSVSEGRTGVLLWCWAGCSPQAVVDALGLRWSDLFYDTATRREPGRRAPIPTRGLMIEAKSASDRLMHDDAVLERLGRERGWAREALRRLGVGWDGERLTLPVTNADGKLHDVLRYDPFGGGRWKMLAGKGKSRLPWPAPELIPVRPKPPWPLLIVEGEGTAISLLSCGIPAVALPGAVSRPTGDFSHPGRFKGVGWHPNWVARFAGFNELALFGDDDDSGRTLMNTVATDLQMRRHKFVHVNLELGDGCDLGDVAMWARTREQRTTLKTLILAAIDTEREAPDQMPAARELVHSWWAMQKTPSECVL